MSYEPKPNQFSLFPNDYKKGPRDPDMKGSVLLMNGKEYWVSAWFNQTSAGVKYIKVNIGREKEPRDEQAAANGQPAHPAQRNPAQPPMGHRDPLPAPKQPVRAPWDDPEPPPPSHPAGSDWEPF